jgi:hypothetical protein
MTIIVNMIDPRKFDEWLTSQAVRCPLCHASSNLHGVYKGLRRILCLFCGKEYQF